MERYKHIILGFSVTAARFPNGREDGYIIKRRNGFSPPVRLLDKFWKVEYIDDYEIVGYWIRLNGKIHDVDCTDYLIIRGKLMWIEKEGEFWRCFTLQEERQPKQISS